MACFEEAEVREDFTGVDGCGEGIERHTTSFLSPQRGV
jgi:hypothetical protein